MPELGLAAVKAADDEPVRGLLPEHGRARSTLISEPTWVMLGGNGGRVCQEFGSQTVKWQLGVK